MFKIFISLLISIAFSGIVKAGTQTYEVEFVNENPVILNIENDEVDLGVAKTKEMIGKKPVADIRFSVFGDNIVGFGTLDRAWTRPPKPIGVNKTAKPQNFDIYEKIAVGETVQIITAENEDVAQIKRIR